MMIIFVFLAAAVHRLFLTVSPIQAETLKHAATLEGGQGRERQCLYLEVSLKDKNVSLTK